MLKCVHIYHVKYVNKLTFVLLGIFQLDACRKTITLFLGKEVLGQFVLLI